MNNVHDTANLNINLRKAFLLLVGWISAVLAIFVYPFVFGMLGVVCGILATKNSKSRIGVYLVVSAIILMGLGLVFNSKLMPGVNLLF